MGVELVALHWIYLLFIVLIIGFMVARKDTSLICIAGIFLLAAVATHSLSAAVSGVFNSFIYAITELLPTILVISIIVAMSKVLSATGINDVMVSPFVRFIRTPAWAYWTIGILMMIISWFFWPSPAVALMGAVLLPAAVRVGLPALGVAMAMNLFGHGIALSGDFIIQGAPKLTADAAGLPVGDVIAASVPLVFVMGAVTTVTAFYLLRRDMKRGRLASGEEEMAATVDSTLEKTSHLLTGQTKKWLALLIPILFALDVIAMFYLRLQGGEATALVGGTAIFILILISVLAHRQESFAEVTNYFIEGFQFGFKVFGPVIPIAAFFYLG
ncbi:hypothetical protein, partial [Geobacillus sp. ZGt-1]